MMRTYVFLNDPDVKQVTTKFGALVLVLGGLAGAAWLAAGAMDDEVASPETSAAAYEKTECMAETELEAWKTAHADVVDAGTYEVYEGTGDTVCVAYDPV